MTDNKNSNSIDDPDLELIKARKMKALKEQFAYKEKERKTIEQNEQNQKKSASVEGGSDSNVSERDFLNRYIYDRGIEVLDLAEQQFPFQTKIIIKRLNELIRYGEISKISGGDLLGIFRSLGLNIRINTNISISDHGKTISFSEKLKQSRDLDQDN
ncbi:MAG: double-stranded DNA-binding protein [Thermoproteota archaeon]|nr:double-stranded DNA-binding protein [Thermoproteota archaeon]